MAHQAPGLNKILILVLFGLLAWIAGCDNSSHFVNAAGKTITTSAGITLVNGVPANGKLFLLYPGTRDTSYIISYRDGKENGVFKTFYPNGKLRELRFFVNGWKEGEHKGWYEDGARAYVYMFKNDMFEGVVKEWSPQGHLFRDMNYEKGMEKGSQKIYYANGKIKSNYVIKDGIRYGLLGTKNCSNVSDSVFRTTKN